MSKVWLSSQWEQEIAKGVWIGSPHLFNNRNFDIWIRDGDYRYCATIYSYLNVLEVMTSVSLSTNEPSMFYENSFLILPDLTMENLVESIIFLKCEDRLGSVFMKADPVTIQNQNES